jgi:hypothetical protein
MPNVVLLPMEDYLKKDNYCKGSKIHFPVYKPLVKFGGGSDSTEFMRLFSSYSRIFAFPSIEVMIDDSINMVPGPYVFRAHHKIDPHSNRLAELTTYSPNCRKS